MTNKLVGPSKSLTVGRTLKRGSISSRDLHRAAVAGSKNARQTRAHEAKIGLHWHVRFQRFCMSATVSLGSMDIVDIVVRRLLPEYRDMRVREGPLCSRCMTCALSRVTVPCEFKHSKASSDLPQSAWGHWLSDGRDASILCCKDRRWREVWSLICRHVVEGVTYRPKVCALNMVMVKRQAMHALRWACIWVKYSSSLRIACYVSGARCPELESFATT